MTKLILARNVTTPDLLLQKRLVGLGYGTNDPSRKGLMLNSTITEVRKSMDPTKQHAGLRLVVQKDEKFFDFFVFENEEIYYNDQ